ncbi:hypothetical protein [uncultured Kiloniella sp.]|uniref:hypothetical protein n=1 Tax=uncultured Kiloniella sp. TaxID=1133091 RepID=UPI0026320622|nr:hypothetical protein [uncultured Kiloniella sp.]
MLVLQILGGLAVFIGVLWAFLTFNNHCAEKFGYQFFTKLSFIIVGIAVGLLLIGNEWRLNSIAENGDILNGIILMIIGICIGLFLIIQNFRATNFLYGFGGSIVQISVFSVLAYFGVIILILGVFLSIIASIGAKRVYVVNQ